MNEIVVIGSGQAAVQAVMSLKKNEFSGSITIHWRGRPPSLPATPFIKGFFVRRIQSPNECR